MKTGFKPVEITQIDPRVAAMQAQASSLAQQDWSGGDGWWDTRRAAAPTKDPRISEAMNQWQQRDALAQEQGALGSGPTARLDPSKMNASDRDLLAQTLQAEAAGEGYDGMLAAGSVIANRAASGKYGDGIRGVIMKPGQFSAWNGVTGYANGEGAIDMANLKTSQTAYQAADAILSNNYKSPVGGATHYYNPAVARPVWGQTAEKPWQKIGNHVFGWGDR